VTLTAETQRDRTFECRSTVVDDAVTVIQSLMRWHVVSNLEGDVRRRVIGSSLCKTLKLFELLLLLLAFSGNVWVLSWVTRRFGTCMPLLINVLSSVESNDDKRVSALCLEDEYESSIVYRLQFSLSNTHDRPKC
jgi:hypothetical protein